MAEIATIARPYAEAVFRVAQNGDLNVWNEFITDLAAIARDADMQAFVANPKINDDAVYSVFASVLGRPISAEQENFLRILIQNGRLAAMSEIAVQFALLKNAREGSAVAAISSAFELSATQVAELLGGLEKKFGVKLKPELTVDPSLIGGVRVSVGDQVLDSSVRTRLEQMRVALTAE
jgi:F-type H+-transporting ATPase subunit delta